MPRSQAKGPRSETKVARQRGRPEVGERRQAILDAALEEFAARGFAATRLDDVARRADVAKGTIYLYFRDKEALFQELVRAMLSPLIGAIEEAAMRELPIRALIELILNTFVNEIYGTRRKDVIRLIITEGSRSRSSCLYTVAKNASRDLIACYRRDHGIRASVLHLFNHESERRPSSLTSRVDYLGL